MILCEKCRAEIPNPDPETFDFSTQCIVVGDDVRALTANEWRFLVMLLAAQGRVVFNSAIANDFATAIFTHADGDHTVRGYRWALRKKLTGSGWTIKTHGGWYGRSGTRLVRA